jgi:predicted porin
MNIGPAGQLSVAFNPNMAGTSNSGSDRLWPATKTQQGYSVGYKVTPVAGLTIGAGLTKIDADRADFQDANAKTLGFSYASAPFAIGAQRINQEGLKTSQAATQKDEIDIISATYAASKEITVGASYAKNERTLAGVKAADETKSYNVALAYNLGPVVASLNYENSYNTPASGTVAPTNGRDVSITKLKVRANY